MTNPKLDAENLTPAEKGARTRAANKALKEAAATATNQVIEDATAVIDEATDLINEAASDEFIVLTVSKVTPKIGSKARNVIYTVGIVLGAIAVAGGPVAAALTGEPQALVVSVVGLANALTNILAKLNLSKTAEDIAKEQDADPTSVG